MVESIETIIIGAGQAGMATSYFLKKSGLEHIILDKASKPGDSWRSQRWDSFTFVSPNWTFLLPGGEYDGPDPDGFMTREEIVGRFEKYAETYQLPIQYNTCVTSVEPLENGGFQIQTEGGEYRARNLVTANGWFQLPKTPEYSKKIPPSIHQIHSSQYKNPAQLPPGAVLVVGAGQSGAQIAEELNESGRKVFLSIGVAPHAPRRYRGQDLFRWMYDSGFADRTYEQLMFFGKTFVAPMISGKAGGRSLNLHIFARDGIILLGHAVDYDQGKLMVAPDLKESLHKSDAAQKKIIQGFDEFILRTGLAAPSEDLPELTEGYNSAEVSSIDLVAEGISSIIWACGFTYGSSMFKMPILNSYGIPDAQNGESQAYPGLYFVGIPFMPNLSSGFFFSVARYAAQLVERLGA